MADPSLDFGAWGVGWKILPGPWWVNPELVLVLAGGPARLITLPGRYKLQLLKEALFLVFRIVFRP
jgi:hypothetical protein